MVWLIPFFLLLGTSIPAAVTLAFVLGFGIGYPALLPPQASWYTELFDVEFRTSGFAFSREVGSLLAGGVAPFIATALFDWTGHWWPIVAYMSFLGLITLVALHLGPETLHKNME